jgi:hypothetical protein
MKERAALDHALPAGTHVLGRNSIFFHIDSLLQFK